MVLLLLFSTFEGLQDERNISMEKSDGFSSGVGDNLKEGARQQ